MVYVTDGAASHTDSAEYPPERLRDVREAEALAGLSALAIGRDCARFLRWPDGTVPLPGSPEATPLIAAISQACGDEPGALVFLPWRRDPHPDHRATAALVAAAVAHVPHARLAEYAVWLEERGTEDDAVAAGEGEAVAVDVASVLERKRRAIDAHRSQLGLVVYDAGTSFTLPASLVARALGGTERFVVTDAPAGTSLQ